MRLVTLLGAAFLTLPARIAAQEFVDRGVFVIERGNAQTGRVEFALRRTGGQGSGGFLLVAAVRTPAHDLDLALQLSKDSVPVTFRQTETIGGRVARRVTAALSGRRLSARASSTETEIARELPVTTPLLILGDEDYTSYAFLPTPEPGAGRAVTVFRARDLVLVGAQVEGGIPDTVRAFGHPVACHRYTLRFQDGELRQFWVAPGGILIRVAIPTAGLVATRTQGPAR